MNPAGALRMGANTEELRERLDLALAASKIGVWEWNLITDQVAWSPHCFSIMDAPDFDGKLESFSKLVHPDDIGRILGLVRTAIDTKSIYSSEFRILRRNSELAWVRNLGRATYDESGRPVRFVGTIQDVTDLNRIHSDLAASELRFAALADSAMDAVITIDENQNIVLFNSAAERMFKYSKEKMIGNKLDAILPSQFRSVHVSHIKSFANTGITSRRMGALGLIHGLRANGEEFPLEASISHLKVAGASYFTAILRDITERKNAEAALLESESRFRQLAENIEDVFWLYDHEKKKVIYVSPAYEGIWAQSAIKVYEDPLEWTKSILPEDLEKVKLGSSSLTEKVSSDYRILRPDGSIRWIRDRSYPVLNEGGKVIRTAGVARDITLQVELEEQVRRAQKLEAIGQLAGGIAHDFNNILGGLLGYSQLVQYQQNLSETTRDYMTHVLEGIHRARDLIRQILIFSRGRETSLQPLQIQPLAKEVLKLLRAAIPPSITIEDKLDLQCPEVLGDPVQIHQLIMNLCTNAYQAMESGAGVLRIELSELTEDARIQKAVSAGKYVRLVVNDTGMGMSPEVQKRIFEPFFTTKPEGKGTGLGLSVVKRIVQQMNGKILFKSVEGVGTEFEILLPQALTSKTNEKQRSELSLERGNKQRILLVDDEVTLSQLGAEILTSLDYRVTEYNSPIKALMSFSENPQDFDLVITDLAMPNLSGYDLIKEVRGRRPDIPVILMSGNIEFNLDQSVESEVDCVLNKPVGIHEYASAVAKCLKTGRQ